MSLIFGLGFFIALPFGLGWLAGYLFNPHSAFLRSMAAAGGAAVPALIMLALTQQADGITRAASLFVTPVLFGMLLLPAGFGVALALGGSGKTN